MQLMHPSLSLADSQHRQVQFATCHVGIRVGLSHLWQTLLPKHIKHTQVEVERASKVLQFAFLS